ncbi:nuclease domain-containing protein [Alkalicoccus urumqiensis]|uniref:DUF2357 domain-containing protein n=1 Tax=Alkalicoccus urumqiensis TaxID=1548213 RepID=A0A2P6MHW8_ALKUR|nr:nuclease domain-containing protein [Alkalicoccus urumqiensis]PRO65867.1 hypothetical protein C6I21_08200 [Alkalicoccus urumqiensis]
MFADIYMIKVWYDHSSPPIEGSLRIRDINIGNKIVRKNDEWNIPTHYRSQNESYVRQIGVRLSDKNLEHYNLYLVSPINNSHIELYYSGEKDIWFESTHFSTRKNKNFYIFSEGPSITGITSAGSVYLSISYKQHSEKFGKIHFLPSALSVDDYEEMLRDLYHIREDLIRDDSNIASIGLSKQKLALNLQEQLNKLKLAVKQINLNPHSTLALQTLKKKYEQYGRFDVRMELEKNINPGNPFYWSKVAKPYVATHENLLIKQMLEELVIYSKDMGSVGSKPTPQLKNLINEREMCFNKSDLSTDMSIYDLEDAGRIQQCHDDLLSKVQKNLDHRKEIRESNKSKAINFDFKEGPHYEDIELVLKMNGIFNSNMNYKHNQSKDSIQAQLDNISDKSPIRIKSYKVNSKSFVLKELEIVKILLKTFHLPSHYRFYKTFNKEAQEDSLKRARIIKIRGKGIITSKNPTKFNSHNLCIEFKYISNITKDSVDISIPKENNELAMLLENTLPLLLNEKEQNESPLLKLKQLEKVKTLSQQIGLLNEASNQFDLLRTTAENLLKMEIFKELEPLEYLPLKPTQLFLHNPPYQSAWQVIQKIKNNLAPSLSTVENQRQIPTKKIEHIYEVWALYKIIFILTRELGWSLNEKSDIVKYLDDYIKSKPHKSLNNFVINLFSGSWKLEVYYEPKIKLSDKFVKPDFVLKFSKDGTERGIAILDAKYRNYKSQGTQLWKKDIEEVAIRKYGNMQPIETNWQLPILISGILHSDKEFSDYDEREFPPFHVYYNESLFNTKLIQNKPHQYSSIYLAPSKLYMFKNWFRLIMEYHLKEYHLCWNCGEENKIQVEHLITDNGHSKFHYSCLSCNEFWVKVHCRNSTEHTIIKHINNYHLQEFKHNKWWVVCPTCGHGKK